jgi:hypothetical protein
LLRLNHNQTGNQSHCSAPSATHNTISWINKHRSLVTFSNGTLVIWRDFKKASSKCIVEGGQLQKCLRGAKKKRTVTFEMVVKYDTVRYTISYLAGTNARIKYQVLKLGMDRDITCFYDKVICPEEL